MEYVREKLHMRKSVPEDCAGIAIKFNKQVGFESDLLKGELKSSYSSKKACYQHHTIWGIRGTLAP